MSLITFLMYAVDKGAAESGNQRVPEGRLHLFELLCGWPGALVGQQFFRHKTRKTSFQVAFWFNVILRPAASRPAAVSRLGGDCFSAANARAKRSPMPALAPVITTYDMTNSI